MAIYGYVRRRHPLPTTDQLKIVSDYACEALFIEETDYQQNQERERLIRQLKPGDTVVVASIQALGKTQVDISTVMKALRQRQVQLISWSAQRHVNYCQRNRDRVVPRSDGERRE